MSKLEFTELSCGDASQWKGSNVDLVFTHPYAPLPKQLRGKPAIINLFGDKKTIGERWVGSELHFISKWGKDLMNTIYVANLEPQMIYLKDLHEDNTGLKRGGWFPLELPLRLLQAYGKPKMVVWDGFMGRGTVGKACQYYNLSYIGIDKDPERVRIAKEYLGVM